MSVQNNLDITINSQILPDFQYSGNANTVKQTSSYNFDEILTSIKKDDSTEVKAPESSKSESETVVGDNKTSETKETSKNEEKPEVKADSEKTTDKTEKNQKSEDEKDVRGEASGSKKTENSKTEKKSDKENQKKLSEEDFSKLNQLSENKDNEVLAASVNKNQTVKNSRIEKDGNQENKNVSLVQNSGLIPSDNNAADFDVNVELSKGESEGETDLTSSDSQNKKSKITTLDKDGKITVEDERTKVPVEETEKAQSKTKTEVKVTGDNSVEMTMELSQNTESNVLSLDNQTAAGSTSNYQAMFSNQLQEAAPDFVQAGKIVLKDNNQGTINLVLHPDDLGNVKIHLSLDGKSVSAQITVATKEAMQVFKDNAETLKEAFIKQGFENANFDVSYGESNSGLGQNSDFNERNDGREFVAQRTYNNFAVNEDSSYVDYENNLNPGNYSVNIVA